mmetsp:Transcript_2567/g.3407  ORF Transcript_2567/g.3407 Transcript_2567/m.3407 type:complete len:402 (+) Transcript_2567:114-1319(+)
MQSDYFLLKSKKNEAVNNQVVDEIEDESTEDLKLSDLLQELNIPEHWKPPFVRRSFLYVPGDDGAKIKKSWTFKELDAVCFDLEDGVSASKKQAARQCIVDALRTLNFGATETFIRINQIDSSNNWMEDLKQILGKVVPSGIVIPKVEDPKQVAAVTKILGDFENRNHVREIIEGKKKDTPYAKVKRFHLFFGIETPRGILNLQQLVNCDDRLQALLFGAEDYAAALGAKRTKGGEEVAFARFQVLNTCAAAGLQALDMINTDFTNIGALYEESLAAYEAGFDGKQVIHPRQIEAVNLAFSPTVEDVSESTAVLKTFLAYRNEDRAVFQVDGRLVEKPHVVSALRILQKASMIDEKESAQEGIEETEEDTAEESGSPAEETSQNTEQEVQSEEKTPEEHQK